MLKKSEMERSYNFAVTTKDVAKRMDIEPEKIDTYLSAYTTTVSIEGSFDANNGSELAVADVVADEKATVEENIEEIKIVTLKGLGYKADINKGGK